MNAVPQYLSRAWAIRFFRGVVCLLQSFATVSSFDCKNGVLKPTQSSLFLRFWFSVDIQIDNVDRAELCVCVIDNIGSRDFSRRSSFFLFETVIFSHTHVYEYSIYFF